METRAIETPVRPSDSGDTGNHFIGRSPFATDPYLDGRIDESRIYNRVLTSDEIGVLATQRWREGQSTSVDERRFNEA